jgi:acetylornithine/N-succinyldiaminopimelate aminotransferase
VASTEQILKRYQQYVIANHVRYPIVMESGAGCRLIDTDGKEYLDLFSGFGAGILGHCHPDLVAAGNRQMNKLWHVGNLLHTEPQSLVAEHIASKGFGGRSFFCHSGADANEAAMKLARLYGKAHPADSPGEHGRFKVISTTRSFHGRSFATMGATGNEAVRKGFEPLLPGFVNVAYNDMAAIERELDADTIAIIVEPIQGEGGVNMPDDGYLPKLRNLCDERDMLLVCDEVWTGCGRTGKWFGHQHWDITPDIMTLGKALGCGLAVGAMCARPKLAEMFDAQAMGGTKHATTLGGNCVSMAVSARMFEVVEAEGLVDRAALLGDEIKTRLLKFAEDHDTVIADLRGKGLFIGVELAEAKAIAAVNACLDRGVCLNAASDRVIRLAPPLVVNETEIDEGLTVLEEVLAE